MIWADASDTRYSVADTASGVPSAGWVARRCLSFRAPWHPTLHALGKHLGRSDEVDPHAASGSLVRQVLREYGHVGLDAA
jgi:hypothetical protein